MCREISNLGDISSPILTGTAHPCLSRTDFLILYITYPITVLTFRYFVAMFALALVQKFGDLLFQ